MASTTGTFGPILTPDQIGDIIIRPLIQQSIAGQVLETVMTGSHEYRIPIITEDVTAAFTAESAEIPVSDAAVSELKAVPAKLSALTVISNELAADADPAALEQVGQGIVRQLSAMTDKALFSASTTDGPAGVPGISGISTVDAGAAYSNVDPFSDAIFAAANHNGVVTAFVTHPDTAAALAKLKTATNYNTPLLQPDPSQPGKRQILGAELLTSPHVDTANNDVWAFSKSQSFFVVRENAEVESDRSVFFTSAQTAIRGIVRLTFAFPQPAAIVKISTSTA
jgi:HK97 family phage major capsid protein